MVATKITCSIQPLKPGERHGTMQECADRKQIRYYGIKKVDKIIIDKMLNKQKPIKEKYSYEEALGKYYGLKTRATHLNKSLEIAKHKNDTKEIRTLKKELEQNKKEFEKILPIAKKLQEEYLKKEEKKLKEKDKKVKKSTKK
jgi:hypothetical protein